jgi:hypothetical protein
MNLVDYEKYYHSGSEFIIPRDEFEKIIEKIQRLKECCTDAYETGQQIIKDLEKENQRLNNVLNETIEYLKYQLSCLDFEKDIKARMLCSMAIVMLERKELKESDK